MFIPFLVFTQLASFDRFLFNENLFSLLKKFLLLLKTADHRRKQDSLVVLARDPPYAASTRLTIHPFATPRYTWP